MYLEGELAAAAVAVEQGAAQPAPAALPPGYWGHDVYYAALMQQQASIAAGQQQQQTQAWPQAWPGPWGVPGQPYYEPWVQGQAFGVFRGDCTASGNQQAVQAAAVDAEEEDEDFVPVPGYEDNYEE